MRIIATFIFPKLPTEEECTNHFEEYRGILYLQDGFFEKKITTHGYRNPVNYFKNNYSLKIKQYLLKTSKEYNINDLLNTNIF